MSNLNNCFGNVDKTFDFIFNRVNDLISIMDTSHRILWINDVLHLKKLGYTKTELISKKLEHIIDETCVESVFNAIENSLNEDIVIECKYKKRETGVLWAKSKLTSFVDDNNQKKILMISQDITEIRTKYQLQEALYETEAKYQILYDSLRDLVLVINSEGRIVSCNPIVLKRLKYSEEELKNKNLRDLHPKDRREEVLELFRELMESKTDTCNIPLVTKEGIEIPVETKVTRGFWEGEEVLFGISRDITKRLKAERKLKMSEEKYRHLFENSPFAITIIDLSMRIIDCNPATEKMLGMKRDELIGEKYNEVSVVHEDFISILVKRFKKFLKGRNQEPIDVLLYNKQGETFWANIQSTLIKVGDKKFIELIGHDITERKNAELLVKEEMEKLKELDRIRNNLIIRVSHELKTPLIPISGGAELLLMAYKDDLNEEITDIIRLIEKGGKRLEKLIENLIDISRIDNRRLELNRDRHNLSNIVTESVNEMKLLLKKKDLELEVNIHKDIWIKIDKIRIGQVITNLISNAIKNTKPGGKIEVTLRCNKLKAILLVKDTGIGLTKKEMERIFTLFGKFERNEDGTEGIDIQGSGLGLFISKRIVDLHYGHIEAHSEGRNRGTTMKVELPIE